MMPSTFVYVGNAESQSVTIFALSPDGALAAIVSCPTETQPRGFAIDPSGVR